MCVCNVTYKHLKNIGLYGGRVQVRGRECFVGLSILLVYMCTVQYKHLKNIGLYGGGVQVELLEDLQQLGVILFVAVQMGSIHKII